MSKEDYKALYPVASIENDPLYQALRRIRLDEEEKRSRIEWGPGSLAHADLNVLNYHLNFVNNPTRENRKAPPTGPKKPVASG